MARVTQDHRRLEDWRSSPPASTGSTPPRERQEKEGKAPPLSSRIYSRSEAVLGSTLSPFTPSHLPLHSPSLHITQFSEPVNPHPLSTERGWGQWQTPGEDLVGQDYLSPSKLRELAGSSELSEVTYLEMKVDTTENSLGNFGSYLPHLSQLRLSSSVVSCVRDLGTSLSSVAVLWMPRCQLRDLDGLTALSSLKELYISFNDVSDVSLVAMLPSLEILDLESNNISENDQLGYLCLCGNLITLTLEGNPLCMTLAEREGGENGYRSAIHKAIPHLQTLDDTPFSSPSSSSLTPTDTNLRSESSVFRLSEAGMEQDLRILQQSIKDRGREEGEGERGGGEGEGEREEEDKSGYLMSFRPKTAPSLAQRSLVLSPPLEEDDSSELTHGLSQVICGNPVRALRARRQLGLVSHSAVFPTSPPPPLPPPSPPSKSLLAELKSWREKHSPPSTPPSSTGFLESEELTKALEEDGIVVTRTKSESNLLLDESPPLLRHSSHRQPAHFPHPPPSHPPQSTAHRHRRLPTPPSTTHPSHLPPRPNSVADFRQRRYRRTSAENRRFVSPAPSSDSMHPTAQVAPSPTHTAKPTARSKHTPQQPYIHLM